MSSSEGDGRKEYVGGDSAVGTTPPTQSGVIVGRPAEGVVQVERVPTVIASPVERREVKRKTTNNGALAAISVGIVVLLSGLYLVLTQVRYMPWPFSNVIVLVAGMILVAIGASMVSGRPTET